MLDAGCRPMGRLFYWAVILVTALGFTLPVFGGDSSSGAATTTVSDTVYLADGTAAQGTLIISWPAFMTAGGQAVAAGNTTSTLGANGALSVALVPNAGATPAGVYYSVVYQLGPGQVKTESWVVPTKTPANLEAVRVTPGSGMAGQPVSMQFVNSALATKADDLAVVHLNGAEVISGAKTFSSSPSVPAPANANDIATKGYVDSSLSNVGAGNFLPTAGGTMTGPITLAASPVAPLQAASKSYVDLGLGGKADLIAGLVPASELGTGTASAGSCLLGNGTWGACGAGGSGSVSTVPSSSQNVAQPAGTEFSANNLANVRYVTASWNWVQSPSDSLATAGSNPIHLAPCPLGIDVSNNANRPYYVYVAGTGTAETGLVTGGTCTPGAANGTIVVTTTGSHAAGYAVGSSTSGIQEAINDAASTGSLSPGAGVVIPPTGFTNALPVYATIYLQSNHASLRGEGKPVLNCKTRSVCLFLGDRVSVNDFGDIEVRGIQFATSNNFDGLQITNTACSANVAALSAANTGANAIKAGDWFDVNFFGISPHYGGIHQATAGTSSTQVTYADTNCGGAGSLASTQAWGTMALENAAIEDNAQRASLNEISISNNYYGGLGWGNWQNHVVVDNDQAFKLDGFHITSGPNCTANYCGQSLYFPGPFATNAAVAWIQNANISLQCGGNGITNLAGNTIRASNAVIQGFAQWAIYSGTNRGGYGGGEFEDIYNEVGSCNNPLYGRIAAAGIVTNGSGVSVRGGEAPIGQMPQFASSGNQGQRYNYCFVVHDSSAGVSKCLPAGFALVDSASPSGNVTVAWPRVSGTGTVTYDVVRYPGVGAGVVTPYTAVCTGGSPATCGSVATGMAQCSAALCSFTDTASANTSSYTVPSPTYFPGLFWLPGGLVALSGGGDTNTPASAANYVDDTSAVTNLSPFVSEDPLEPQFTAQRCGAFNPGEFISCFGNASGGNNSDPPATLLHNARATSAVMSGLKGRVNFFGMGATSNGEIQTLIDCNPFKTLATTGNRPTADNCDTYLGQDQGTVGYSSAGLALGAPVSISQYINSIPNGSYLERLTAAAKTFNVPVTVNGNLNVTSGTVTLPITGTGSQCLHVSSTGVVSGTGTDCGSGSGTGTVNSGVTSQVAMYSGSGSTVSGDSALTDNGTSLNYSGSGGISAATGTFTGNLTVNGQLQVAGPWTVSSPIPGTVMAATSAGTSALGISNDGNFYISTNGGAPQKVATAATSSYFSNLFQEDGNDLGMYNGTTAQNLHVYSSFTNASTYQRTSVGYDATSGYAVLRSEIAPSGTAPGLGFWINSGLKWVIDPTSNLKPWVNNSYNVGSTTFAPATVYAATAVDTLTQGRLQFELCNDGTTGTSLNFLAKYNGASLACAVKAGTADADGVLGVVSGGSGTTGNAVITYRGYASCSFDGSTAAGDYVVESTSTAGDCHDAGAVRPAGVQVIGRVESTNSGTGTYGVRVAMEAPSKSASVPDSTAVPWFTAATLSATALGVSSSANKAALFGIVLPFQKTTTQITYEVGTADNTANTYDIGIYSGASAGICTLQAHIGATPGTTFAPSTGYKTLSWSGGGVTLAPGRYYLAYTASATSGAAALGASTGTLTFAGGGSAGTWGNVGVISGGTLPASVTCPTDSYNSATVPAWAVN